MRKQVQQVVKKRETVTDTPPRVQVNVNLEGEDAEKFLRYQSANKLQRKAAAGYRLIMERLEQVQSAA